MKVELYKPTIANGKSEKVWYKDLNLDIIPNIGEYFLEEETGQGFEIKEKYVSATRIILILGRYENPDRRPLFERLKRDNSID